MRTLFAFMFAVVAGGLFVALTPAVASPSAAPLNFCNGTSADVAVAWGYHSEGVNDGPNHNILTGPFVSTGWRTISPNQCQSLSNPFDARYMFWFAMAPRAADRHLISEDTTTSGTDMCISGAEFTFEDQNVSMDACHRDPAAATNAGTRWVLAHKVDTAVNPTVNFTGYDY